jgi:hypothetical protein
MQNYYFTFGQSHWHKEGIPMKGFWVRVKASDYYKAREIFISEFSSIYMQTPSTWGFQYEEYKFKKELFPSEEFMCLEEKEEVAQ